MAGGMRGKDDAFRETLAERVDTTRSRKAGLGHGTADFHGRPPNASSAWTATTPPADRARPASPAAVPPAARPHRSASEPVRPCWYDGPWGRQPALLLQWRRVDEGSSHGSTYHGLIVVAAPDETGAGWTVIRLWADASFLSPA
jgi:hypothetical protein